MTGEFPAQRVINAENVSIWWYHHVKFDAKLTHASHTTIPVSSKKKKIRPQKWYHSFRVWLMNSPMRKHYQPKTRTQRYFCVHSANERWRYTETPSLIGWAYTQNDPCEHEHPSSRTTMMMMTQACLQNGVLILWSCCHVLGSLWCGVWLINFWRWIDW